MLSLSLDFAVGDFQVLGQRRLARLHAHDLLQVGAIKVELAHNYRRTTIARCQRHTLAADRRHAEVVRDHHGDLVRTGLDPEKSGLLVHRNLLFRMPRERAVVQHRLADRLEGQLEIRVHRELV